MKKRIFYLTTTAFLLVLIACGGGGGGYDAPAEATITISPSTYTVNVSTGFTETTYTQYFLIVVKDKSGIPLNNVNLEISFPWAQPNDDVVQLYDGDNPQDSPMTAQTDENGSYTLRFDYTVGQSGGVDLEYKGDLQVISGSLFKSASFEVAVTSDEE